MVGGEAADFSIICQPKKPRDANMDYGLPCAFVYFDRSEFTVINIQHWWAVL